MPQRISDALGTSHAKLEALGAFDAFVDVDSHFHLHPGLLGEPRVPELVSSHQRFEAHFANVIVLLDAASSPCVSDTFFRRAVKSLIFPEISLAGLGFSKESTQGRAIGVKLAAQLATTAFQIVKAGIKEPAIFELAGLFEEGIGADLISDMCLALILPDVLAFNARVAHSLALKTENIPLASYIHALPITKKGEPVLLLPREILSPLPIASTWEEISTVSAYNNQIRNDVNRKVGRTWGKASQRLSKHEIKRLLLNNPDLLRDLVARYRRTSPAKYDYSNDPFGEIVWFDAAKEYSAAHPLSLLGFDPSDHLVVKDTVLKICKRFKRLIEDNGLFKLLYDQSKTLKPERAAQLLFYGIADAYCNANDLDLTAEANAGRGPVDFKVSKGYRSRLNVEVKYTSNPRLVHGYEKQLKTYDSAEQTFDSIYLIIQTGPLGQKLRMIERMRAARIEERQRAAAVILVDGTYQASASKLK